MSLARVKSWSPGDILTASDLNSEFNNVLNNPISLISPTTGAITFSTGQTFPLGQVVATSGVTGSVISGSTATSSPLVAGTVIIPGTAPLQLASTTQLQLGLGVIPLKVGTQWVQRAVPTAITLESSSTGGSTGAMFSSGVFYVYAYDSTGTTLIDFATTGAMPHSPSTENGVEVATTDSTRALIGMIRMTASTHFQNTSSERFVATWHGKTLIPAVTQIALSTTTTTTTYAEVNSSARCHFLTWGGPIAARAGGGDLANSGAGGFVFFGVALDTTTISPGAGGGQSVGAGNRFFYMGLGSFTSSQVTEGYHYITPVWRVNANTATLSAAASIGEILNVETGVVI